MPANIQQVSFQDPRLLYAPDSVVQQQQIQRQQQLADALRAQAQADMPAAPGSHVSWTQGAAKVVAALLAKQQYKKIDQGNTALAQQYASALRGQFGGGRAQPPAPTQPQAAPETLALPATGQNINIPAPNQPPQADAGPAPAMSPGGGAGPAPRGPWSLSGNQQQDMNDYMLNPEKYGEAVIAAHAPVDMSKMVRQAQEAASNGDFATAAALYGNIEKQNNIPLQPGRPGAPMFDHTGKIVAMAPQNVEGGNPVIEDGKFTGSYTQAPGVTGVVQAVNAAKAAGTNSNEPISGYDTQGNPIFGNKLDAAHGGNGSPGGLRPGLQPGSAEFLGGLGKHGSDYFADLQTKAQPINNQIYALRQMVSLANGPTVYGPGSDAAVKTAGILNQFGQALGVPGSFNDKNVTNQQEMSKWAGQVAANAATAMGLNGSDARFNIALESNPSGHLTNTAIKQVGTQVIGLTQAIGGQAQAGARFAAQHPGAQAQGQFQSMWNQNYDPRIYTWLAQGPQVVKQNMAALKRTNPADYASLVSKAKWLGDYGALPQ